MPKGKAMTATVYAAQSAWNSAARYTAAAFISVRIQNNGNIRTVYWTTTTSDTAPTIAVTQGNILEPLQAQPMELLSGERLWMAVDGVTTQDVTLEV
jgi:hypothetical protein